MDINTKLENKIVNEAFKQLLIEEPDIINNVVEDIKNSFKSINLNETVKIKMEDIIINAFENQIGRLEEDIEECISDNFYFGDVINKVMEEFIEPQIEKIIVDKIKSIKIK